MRPANQEKAEATHYHQVAPIPDPAEDRGLKDQRGSWYLLTGLMLGLIIGLIYAWVLNPLSFKDTHPASLSDSFKASYRSLIAKTYQETGNLTRAVSRLALLEDPDPVYALGAQAQQALAEGQTEEAYALALLASALQGSANAEPVASATPLPIPTRTLPVNTPTP